MFRIDRDPTGQLNGIDNPSLLYTASDELLTSSLLTPDPDNKFDISGSKTDDAPFGDFHTLGIYEQYNESGPSSVQFGDGLEPSEHGGSHLSTKDEVSGATLRATDWHARANGVGHSPLSRSYHVDVPGHLQNSTKIAMGNQGPLIGRHMSPIQQELLDSSPVTDQDILDHIVVQTSVQSAGYSSCIH
jgi:lysine-specific histone demethylase 1